MVKSKPSICVFCGSSHGVSSRYADAARRFGALLAERGFSLVFGAGNVGLMGETARAARDGGAEVVGILPQFLRHLEPPMKSGEDLIVTPDLQQRKARMLGTADGFAVLPGGLGTLDEFFEIVTSAQLQVLHKPIAVLNVDGFFDPLEKLLTHIVSQGFARSEISALYRLVATPEDAISFLAAELGRAPRG